MCICTATFDIVTLYRILLELQAIIKMLYLQVKKHVGEIFSGVQNINGLQC